MRFSVMPGAQSYNILDCIYPLIRQSNDMMSLKIAPPTLHQKPFLLFGMFIGEPDDIAWGDGSRFHILAQLYY